MNRAHLLLAPLAAAAMAAAAPLSAAAQTGPAPVLGVNGTLLTVSAEGKVTRTPDLALFSAGVVSQGKSASEALAANSADMTRVIANEPSKPRITPATVSSIPCRTTSFNTSRCRAPNAMRTPIS